MRTMVACPGGTGAGIWKRRPDCSRVGDAARTNRGGIAWCVIGRIACLGNNCPAQKRVGLVNPGIKNSHSYPCSCISESPDCWRPYKRNTLGQHMGPRNILMDGYHRWMRNQCIKRWPVNSQSNLGNIFEIGHTRDVMTGERCMHISLCLRYLGCLEVGFACRHMPHSVKRHI